ncbi:MAG: hypothetical protein ACRERC_15325, partial [Candidatus Binatia bacterium]
RLGLVARVVAADRLFAAALAAARGVAQLDLDLVRRLKRALTDGLDLALPQGLALERRLAAMHPAT